MSIPSGTSPRRASEARSAPGKAGAIFSDLSTRSRILLLVFSSALPILVLATFVALEQREAAEARARAELQSRAKRRKRAPFSVILHDIDHFKKVNDTWGHDAGDAVLKQVAAVIPASVRGSDIAVRHGGEEFAMLLPDTTTQVARQRADELRRALAVLDIRHGAGSIRITASFGVAEYTDHGDDGMALMNAADEAMYAAKNAGRNQIVVSPAHARRRTPRSA